MSPYDYNVNASARGEFGVIKFQNPVDIDSDFIISLNQINARHVDETMRGSYKYAPMKVVVAKIVERDPKKPGAKDILFIDGDYFDGNTLNLRF